MTTRPATTAAAAVQTRGNLVYALDQIQEALLGMTQELVQGVAARASVFQEAAIEEMDVIETEGQSAHWLARNEYLRDLHTDIGRLEDQVYDSLAWFLEHHPDEEGP